jgi:hypothetical protein
MRVARLLARLLVAAAALLLTAVFDPAAGLASTQPGFSTEPRVVEHPPVGAPKLVGLRAGRHPGFDRVVFQLDGPIPSSSSVRCLPVVRLDGSGEPLSLRGNAFLEVVVRAPTHDQDGRPVRSPTRLRPDFAACARSTPQAPLRARPPPASASPGGLASGCSSSPARPGSSLTSPTPSRSTTAAFPPRGGSPSPRPAARSAPR